MSHNYPTAVEIRELRYRCEQCAADPSEWCENPATGRETVNLHTARFDAATRDGALPIRDAAS